MRNPVHWLPRLSTARRGRLSQLPAMRLLTAVAASTFVLATAAADGATSPGIRFVGQPIVAFTRASPGSGWNFTLVARFARPLPRTPTGRVDASFLLDGAEPGSSVFRAGVRARHCYSQVLDTGEYPASLRHPRAGQ